MKLTSLLVLFVIFSALTYQTSAGPIAYAACLVGCSGSCGPAAFACLAVCAGLCAPLIPAPTP